MSSIGAPAPAVAAFNVADALGKTGRLPEQTAADSLENSMPSKEKVLEATEESEQGDTGLDEEEDVPTLEAKPLSDMDVLSLPPGIIRLLSIFRPLIASLSALLRVASWTAGPHTAPISLLLVLGWWAICKFSYPILCYAPQLPILGLIAWYYLVAHWAPLGPKEAQSKHIADVMGNFNVVVHGKSGDSVHTVANAASLAATVAQVQELADFAATVHTRIVRPFRQTLDWSNPSATLAVASFLLVTYPLYLICFLPWSQLGLPRLVLVLASSMSFVEQTLHAFILFSLGLIQKLITLVSPQLWVNIEQLAVRILLKWQSVQPYVHHLVDGGLYLFNIVPVKILYPFATPSSLSLIPPFPLFSLDVSTAFLVIGTVILTWCSPLFVLVRQALWHSSLLRYTVRKVLYVLTLGFSGPIIGEPDQVMRFYHPADIFIQRKYNISGPLRTATNQAGSQPSGVPSSTLSAVNESEDPFRVTEGAQPPSPVWGPALPDDILQPIAKGLDEKVQEFKDVVYQFSIFENQRWWVGLDWTAALLPQERASWTDEGNNAVLPPSSFNLPTPKLQIQAVGQAGKGQRFIKRLSQWRWIDQEWTIAGTGYISAVPEQQFLEGKAGQDGDSLADSVVSGLGGQVGALAGSLTDSLRARLNASNLLALSTLGASAPPSTRDQLDVDSDGWQYGGNSWENMGPQAGMGKYTRRRKWVRRAVLVELVQRDYTPSEQELEKASITGALSTQAK